MRWLAGVFLLVLIVSGAGGCAPTPAVDPMHYRFSETEFDNRRSRSPYFGLTAAKCEVFVRSIEDKRHGKEGFGAWSHLDKYAESVPIWVRDSLGALELAGYKVAFNDHEASRISETDFLILDIAIHKAYLHSLSVAKNATVVLSVTYQGLDHSEQIKVYRKQNSSINWGSSASEGEGAMNKAMTHILAQVADDIDRLCAAKGVVLQESR